MDSFDQCINVLGDLKDVNSSKMVKDLGYRELSKDGDCYFCGAPKWANFYSPSIIDRRAKGIHGDMIVYIVCAKCLGRCQRKSSLSHDERALYVSLLQDRGSRQGRVNYDKEVTPPLTRQLVKDLNVLSRFNGRVKDREGNFLKFTLENNELIAESSGRGASFAKQCPQGNPGASMDQFLSAGGSEQGNQDGILCTLPSDLSQKAATEELLSTLTADPRTGDLPRSIVDSDALD